MRVFVAGATGVLGRPVVRRLVEAGHEVTGLTRSSAKVSLLRELGARGVVGDALHGRALEDAVVAARAEAVLHLLTALSKGLPGRGRDLAPTNELRVRATRHLLAAAQRAGARHFVAESMVLAYGFGDLGGEPLRESSALSAPPRNRAQRETVLSLRSLEEQTIAAGRTGRMACAALRLGLFYGPEASGAVIAALRRRALPLPGGGAGAVHSFIHSEDAATAVVAALTGGATGVFNVVDDEPTSLRAFLSALAEATAAPRPRRIPMWLARWLAPYSAAVFSTRLPVSNALARERLGWVPRFPSYRQGLAELDRSLHDLEPAAYAVPGPQAPGQHGP
ncbi:MAG: NAD(P)-dependent oxidoreductase [Deltaproteobacteria bacterium]|nr:NAD(P)-dependent oxidoreductase [Deltaproteobacteria bacterium]